MSDTLYQGAALILPLVMAIVFHEVAHGYVARLLGDSTADDMGRLTLNPLRHVDPVGTVILPGMLALAHMPVFGWAKPVPVVPRQLRNPRRDMMLVALAGPGSNLVLAALGAVVLGLMVRLADGAPAGPIVGFVALNLFNFLSINVFLALFNLLPIPPFDGSHVVEGLLPRRLAAAYAGIRRTGFMLVLLLLVVLPQVIPGFDPVGRLVGPPVDWVLGHYLRLADLVANA
ncbi:site-2 protease family protein [Novosphingobium flavum]|uniref:Site-2 protease family protein n=1 Tax=Novosphingobium aerophilum TaxID=2839843 RepID=A0A7X1F8H0_9SPHN|nr:site-2 protease family protein [Novosphingobium aerophilum]MBC2652305.1 site-2 protease family protein [Novosphingobium aerophilum]MBC2660899.1 site-2 protease family protein [Novosphingobium aerophilum]